MPLSQTGKKVRRAMREEYGKEKGDQVFYAKENKDQSFSNRVRKAEWWANRLVNLSELAKSKILGQLKKDSSLFWWVNRIINLRKSGTGHSGFLVEVDGEKHLPTEQDGRLSHHLMGAAWAALHGGYRGNSYEGPNKQEAISKLKKLYEKQGIKTPSEKAMPGIGHPLEIPTYEECD